MNWPALGIDAGWATEQLRELSYTATAVEKQVEYLR